MSYILEALRKSERERRLGQVPSLPTLELDAPAKRSRWLPWLLSLLLAINAGIFAVFWLQDRGTAPAAVPAGAPKSAGPVEAEAPPKALEQKLLELENRLAKIAQPAPVIGAAVPPAVPTPATETPVAAPIRRPEKIQANAPIPGRPKRDSIDPPTARAAQDSLSTPRKRAEAPVESEESDLPQAIRALKINVLAHSADPAERFAVIDMTRRAPGDRLPGGIVLVDVLADGLLLELHGERFRIRH